MTIEKHQGFSLIELLIVIAIVGILASIAIPSYQSSVDRSRRAQGQAYALDLAARQERFYSTYGTYTTIVDPGGACAGAACGLNMTDTSDPDGNVANGWYTVTNTGMTNTPAGTFQVTLTPAWTDSLCGNLTYNNLQQKGLSGSHTGAVADCWR